MTVYFVRSLVRGGRDGCWNPGKDIVIATTALCWYVGIIVFNSDYAFTVTNIVIHGVPYLVLVYWTWSRRTGEASNPEARLPTSSPIRRVLIFLGPLWMLAFVEELLWDRGVWHEREWLFGTGGDIGEWRSVLVPLLVVPQVSNYILDGFIWKRRSNPDVRELLDSPTNTAPPA